MITKGSKVFLKKPTLNLLQRYFTLDTRVSPRMRNYGVDIHQMFLRTSYDHFKTGGTSFMREFLAGLVVLSD